MGYPGNARVLKGFSVLFVVLLAISLLPVHASSYDPPVSFVLFCLAASVGIVAAGVVPLLRARQFTLGFCGAIYALYAAVAAMLVFFSGGPSSELYLLFFPLLLASALHGAWRTVLVVLTAVLSFLALAMLPGLLESGTGEEVASSVFYRIGTLGLAGLFLAHASRRIVGSGEGLEEDPEDGGGALLLERVEDEISAHRGMPVAVILVDPGEVRDPDLLLDRVDARIGEPFLEESDLFGLAAASSLSAQETRAGAAIYPRDARSTEDLIYAAGRALEASFEVEGPSAIVLAGRNAPEEYRAAR